MKRILSKNFIKSSFLFSRRISCLHFTIIKKILVAFYFTIEGVFDSALRENFACYFPLQQIIGLLMIIIVGSKKQKFIKTAIAFGYVTDFVGFIELVYLSRQHGSMTSKYLAFGLLLKSMDSPLIESKEKFISYIICVCYFFLRILDLLCWIEKFLMALLCILGLFNFIFERNRESKEREDKQLMRLLKRQSKMSSILSKKGQTKALMIDPSNMLIQKRSIFSSVVSLINCSSSKDKSTGFQAKESSNAKIDVIHDGLSENKIWIDYFVNNFQLEELEASSILTRKSPFEQYLLELSDLITKDIENIKMKAASTEEIVRGSGLLKESLKKQTLKMIKFKIFAYFDDYDKKPLLILILKDRTLKKENEKLKNFDQFKDKLLGIVVHDMRAPLSMVLSTIESSRHTDSLEEIKNNLDLAEINAKLLDCLISDILDYSLFKEKRLNLVCKYFYLQPILEESMSLIRLQAFHKKVTLYINNSVPSEKLLYSDERRLKQVLINLLTNAIKFTQSGSITLTVLYAEEFDNTVSFQVIDTGAGIKKENLERLGEAFATFDVPEGLNKQGIGLGLYISRTIVSQIGPANNFIINSQEGVGTQFKFFMFEDIRDDDRKTDQNYGGFEQNPTFYPNKTRGFMNKTSLAFGMDSISQRHSDQNFSADIESSEINDDIKIPEYTLISPQSTEKNPFFRDSVMESNRYALISNSPMNKTTSNSDQENKKSASIEIFESDSFNIASNNNFKPISSDSRNLSCPHILIADDNIFNTLVLESLLKKAYKNKVLIEKASDGVQAVSAYEKLNKKSSGCPLDIIFMDFLMPIMDGIRATSSIKELAKDQSQYEPVIIAGLSAMVCNEEEKNECFSAGMDFIFQKPIREDTLLGFMKISS